MLRISYLTCFLTLFFFNLFAQDWQPVKGGLMTSWAENVNPGQVHREYPRPQMQRATWQNLNGLWEYAIKEKGASQPDGYEGKILVPFPVESALSGVKKTVGKEQLLWYRRQFKVNAKSKGKRVLLHFGAVDWQATVYVNGQQIGVHEGGYDPFSFDITEALQGKGLQELVVSVWDPTDDGPQPRGKQINKPHAIWYTPVSGIWQTVWLETVPETYIHLLKNTPDLDQQRLHIQSVVMNVQPGDQLQVQVVDQGKVLSTHSGPAGMPLSVYLENPELWSPNNPYLYDLKISLKRGKQTIDAVESYFAMRKISMEPDENGIQRMMLNNEFVFQYGPLDQGWWPDGLYTAPSEEALVYDIQKTKEMGFNMIRKHVKVEPARWYYHCDKLGMLVWQDMPSGDMGGNHWSQRPGVTDGTERSRTPESEAIFRTEWKAIMDAFHNFPSIVVWVPFNEAWGQFKTVEVTEWTMQYDPSRLVNSASGGNFYPVGHILDLHNYPDPAMPRPRLFGKEQILVLGEFGGLGLPIENHTWQKKDNWGYQSFKNADDLLGRYQKLMEALKPLITQGLSAAIYTQTTDVEAEVNGLITYDRKKIKMDTEQLKQLHLQLYKIFPVN
ncbi:sugar-binding domain-containing protein [Rapidithrix thailandica]|uniref:Sugar-binding domain-containing protein n=1 Tax=Rapidithrix thailandica TaxID=413964 RepID=A0AAW9SBA9_9BACT